MRLLVAFIHDHVWFPILHLVSPRFRTHQRYVRTQNAHLDQALHTTADPTCDYCVARSTDLGQRVASGAIPAADPRVLPQHRPTNSPTDPTEF